MGGAYSQRGCTNLLLPPANEVWGKVICLTACVCPRGGVWSGGDAWSQGMPGLGGAWSQGGACLVGCLVGGVPGGDPPDGYCCRFYASYWNGFLFCNIFAKNYMKMKEFETGEPPLDLPMKLLGNGIFKKLPTIIQLGHDSSDFNLSWQYSNVSSSI